ncbi:hypothetical protein BSZ39_12560 [Bowdeniella nasicola]|uniref:Uncharacterized protein n=1 Tax=Bowdeniella nasicola TaxID=208480 RepID=A0A1Q5PY49_9ACTO|nr:hypothetical protein BSZ39_12560 [Bowdeniella nasicola]
MRLDIDADVLAFGGEDLLDNLFTVAVADHGVEALPRVLIVFGIKDAARHVGAHSLVPEVEGGAVAVVAQRRDGEGVATVRELMLREVQARTVLRSLLNGLGSRGIRDG